MSSHFLGAGAVVGRSELLVIVAMNCFSQHILTKVNTKFRQRRNDGKEW